MVSDWANRKLSDLGVVRRGKSRHRPRNAPFLYGGEYPFIQTGDVKEANLYISSYSQTYNEQGLSQSRLWDPETLLITIAANIAETAILKIRACFPDSIVGFIADPKKADVRFIKYCIDITKARMQNVSRGTTQDNLSVDKLLSFDLLVPNVATQRKIASILSAYDDLIENNTRRIRILEEMAQRIYRHWFVDFKFPGHEKTKFVDSPLGRIPEGWEVKQVKDLVTICRGRSYKSENLTDSGLPFLNLKCIERDGGFRYDGIKQYSGPYKDSQTAAEGDVIMAVTDMTQERRIVARAARVPHLDEPYAVLSMDLVKIVPEASIDKTYLYGMFRYSGFSDSVKQYATGVNVLHLGPDSIGDYALALPTKELRDAYGETATPLYYEGDILQTKNTNLRQTRDLLLPKLISGEIEVS